MPTSTEGFVCADALGTVVPQGPVFGAGLGARELPFAPAGRIEHVAEHRRPCLGLGGDVAPALARCGERPALERSAMRLDTCARSSSAR
jgi:hypothetical protein